MMDYVSVGPAPYEENCAQVGQPDYPERSRIECRVFANQLRRVLGEPPAGARIGVKTFEHDFGTYREVVVYYDEDDDEAASYAFRAENEYPARWDKQAIKELREAGLEVKYAAL